MKLKLTTAGIQTYQQTMYRLSDEQLKLHSDCIIQHPWKWLNQYFLLTRFQFSFFKSLDAASTEKIVRDLSFAIEKRLWIDIHFTKPEEAIGKLVMEYDPNGRLRICFKSTDNVVASETLSCHYTKENSFNFSNKAIKSAKSESAQFDNLKKTRHGI